MANICRQLIGKKECTGMDDRASRSHPYTVIFTTTHPQYGTLTVCVEGHHEGEDDAFNPLDYEFFVFLTDRDGDYDVVPDVKAAQEAVSLATSVYYMMEGEIVSTEDTPVFSKNLQTATVTVDEFGTIEAQSGGVVMVDNDGIEDYYQILTAHPKEGVYLVIILEIIGSDPLAFRSIDLEDEELCTSVIDAYLADIGAIEDNENGTSKEGDEDEDFEEEDDLSGEEPVPDSYFESD